jgi:uncharacterized protein (TIGR02678 family)
MTTISQTNRSAVEHRLSEQLRDERRRAIVALLRRPLLLASGATAEAYALVRKHNIWVRDWFARHAGWALQLQSEVARLRKTPANVSDATRPLLDSKEQRFTRRRYVLLCLTLAVLERSERQTVLRQLAEGIAGEFASNPEIQTCGISFDLTVRDHRRDLVEVIKCLIEFGILRRLDGDEQQFISSEAHDVLYTINTAALAVMLNVRRGPSTIATELVDIRIQTMLDEFLPDTEEGRNRRIRVRLFRTLLDDPVIYYSQLEENERQYLLTQRPSLVRELEVATGLIGEARREGLAMVDLDEVATDVKMPEEGTDGHVTLLIAEHLAGRLRAGLAGAVRVKDVEQFTELLIREHRTHWRKDAREPGAAHLLARQALWRLQMLRLIEVDDEYQMIFALPAIGRYALGEVRAAAVEEDSGSEI